jgi:hypothetical protein
MGLVSDHCPCCDAEMRLEVAVWQSALELRCPDCATVVELMPDVPPASRVEPLAA